MYSNWWKNKNGIKGWDMSQNAIGILGHISYPSTSNKIKGEYNYEQFSN